MPVPGEDLQLGAPLDGKYAIGQRLGQGGMGAVPQALLLARSEQTRHNRRPCYDGSCRARKAATRSFVAATSAPLFQC